MRMAKITPETKILTQSEVNKRIIAKTPKVRSHDDLLGPFDRYNDENFEIYKRKNKQFLEAAQKYNRMNQDTCICSREILNNDYLVNIDYNFLSDNEEIGDSSAHHHSSCGRRVRKRTERYFDQVPEKKQIICHLEPWFRRYLILNKFIWAARKVVIMNRMQKRLDILKNLDENTIKELENIGPKVYNISYANVFEKFLTSL